MTNHHPEPTPRVLTRRDALKGILATGALTTLSGCALGPASSGTFTPVTRLSPPDQPDWLRTARHRVAYDFHFADQKPEFLSQLDPEATAKTLSEAGVQMVQLCAKNLFGYTTYPTSTGKLHPLLHGRDYFKESLTALQARGIHCIAYYADCLENIAAKEHPEWRFLNAKQSRGEEEYFPDEWWKPICPETGYSEYLILQMKELVTNYPTVDGIILDGIGFPGYCYCKSCRTKFRAATGLEIPEKEDWAAPGWRKFIAWRYDCQDRQLEERRAAIKAINPKAIFSYNYGATPYHYYAGSHDTYRAQKYADYVTTETLPWDFLYGLMGTSQMAKYVRGVAEGKPIEIVGARTHGAHDYTEKPLSEMMLETYSALAHNVPYCIIESTDWNGLPNHRGFDLMRQSFARSQALDPWVRDSEPTVFAGLVYSRRSADMYCTEDKSRVIRELNGFYKVCIEKHLPVGFLIDETLTPENLARHAVVVLADSAMLNEKECKALRQYVANGGGLIATHQSTARNAEGKLRDHFLLADVFGCDIAGPPLEGVTWFAPTRQNRITNALGGTFALFREKPCYLPIKGAAPENIMAERWEPPFEKPNGGNDGFNHTAHYEPPYRRTGETLAVMNAFGKGRSLYFSPRVGGAYAARSSPITRELLYESLLWAANKPNPISTDAPMAVETVLNRQGSRLILHLLNFSIRDPLPYTVMDAPSTGLGPMRKSWITYDEVIPLGKMTFSVQTARAPKSVYLAPSRTRLPFRYKNGYVTFSVNDLHDATTIAIETA